MRVGATLIDGLLLLLVTAPLLTWIYGWGYWSNDSSSFFAGPADFVITWVAPAAAIVLFWLVRGATPGKMALSLQVVDASTGNPLTSGQAVIRYLTYILSVLPLGLGLIWVGIDRRKQGWHDKIARTVVVRAKLPEPVRFDPT